MNPYSIPPLLSALAFFYFGTIVFFKSKDKLEVRLSYTLQCLATFLWEGAWTILFNIHDQNLASLLIKIGYSGIIFIPTTFFHFATTQVNRGKKWLYLYYPIGFIFLIALWFSNAFISGHFTPFWSSFYARAGFLHPFYLIYLGIIAFHCLAIYYIAGKEFHWKGVQGNKNKYLFFAVLIYCIAAFDFVGNYEVNLYPFGYFFTLISLGLVAYAVTKFRLLDINIIFVHTAIFIFVYAVVLGIPFGLIVLGRKWLENFFGLGWFWVPMLLLLFLATAGPFLFQLLRRRAEDLLLHQQRLYQQVLHDLSSKMTRIRELDELVKVISSTISRAVQVNQAVIYIKDEDYYSYRLRSSYPKEKATSFKETIALDEHFIQLLYLKKKPFFTEELGHFEGITLDAGLVIPCFIEDNLIGFIILGPKPQNQMYTADDIALFENFSYAASLAIENSIFWKEIEERQRQARIQEMDLFSYSLAHEIDNPISSIIGQANLLKKQFRKLSNFSQDEQKETEKELGYILEAAWRVAGMVDAIQDLGQRESGESVPLNIKDVIASFAQLYEPIFKYEGAIFTKDIPEGLPLVKGIKPELMQILVIFSNNSLHALLGSKQKEIHLKVALSRPGFLRISLEDTGYGITKEKLHAIFAPFVTTKASTEGTGMGLYNAKKIIERHQGRIWAESPGPAQGATFFVEIPTTDQKQAPESPIGLKANMLFGFEENNKNV